MDTTTSDVVFDRESALGPVDGEIDCMQELIEMFLKQTKGFIFVPFVACCSN